MTLDEDLQRILNVGAKIYHTHSKHQGKVLDVRPDEVTVEYLNSTVIKYPHAEFCELLTSDVIVANHRLTMGAGNQFKIMPRAGKQLSALDELKEARKEVQAEIRSMPKPVSSAPSPAKPADLQTGYINFTTGRYSDQPKKGYTKIEYRKAVEKVTLEVDSDMIEKLREMGLLK